MGADYQLLVGQQFDSNGVPYAVREVVWFENRWIARAEPVQLDDNLERDRQVRSFPVNYVLRRVVVDEEIELFSPRWNFGEPF